MRFEQPDLSDKMREAMSDVDASGESTEHVGKPLDPGVRTALPDYAAKLQLTLEPIPDELRRELARIRWGKIDREAARLAGLGAALEDLASCITSGIKRIESEHAWSGDAFEAFKETAAKVVAGIMDAIAQLRNAAETIQRSTQRIRELITEYNKTSLEIFRFDGMPKHDELHVLDGETIDTIPLCGMDCHNEDGSGTDAQEDLPGDTRAFGRRAIARAKASMKVLTSHWLRWYKEWDGQNHGEDIDMSTARTENECYPISEAIERWYAATDKTKSEITQAFTAALVPVTVFAESGHFKKLSDDVVQ